MRVAKNIFTRFVDNMKVQQNSTQQYRTPNFKSRIKFVTSKEFNNCNFRDYFYCNETTKPLIDSFTTFSSIWSPNVKTCTAGGLVNKEKNWGFHLYDCIENIKNVRKDFKSIINADKNKYESALIIGSKDLTGSPNSIPLFEEVQKTLQEIVTPSIFKTFKNIYSACDIGYDKNLDTWFINLNVIINKINPFFPTDIMGIENIKDSFEKIQIAPQDELFIGDEQIKKEDFPELFA